MKALNARQVDKIWGLIVARQRGSHKIYKHAETGKTVHVPVHKASRPLKTGTLLAIIKQSGIDRNLWK